MIYQVKDIVQDVRIAIDQNMTSEQLIATEDIETLSLNTLIRSKVEEAARRVISSAPAHFIDSGIAINGKVTHRKATQSGWIHLSDDFMRLVIFKMSNWERPVYQAISAESPRYAMQFSRFPGIRGSVQKPVVAITRRSEGLALEFFPFIPGAGIEQSLYFPFPKIDELDGINIPEHCYKSAVYQAAALTLSTYNQNEAASVMTSLSESLLQ